MIARFQSLTRYTDLIALLAALVLMLAMLTRGPAPETPGFDGRAAVPMLSTVV